MAGLYLKIQGSQAMTVLQCAIDDYDSLKELLIKNLPPKINGSNEKAAFKYAPIKTVDLFNVSNVGLLNGSFTGNTCSAKTIVVAKKLDIKAVVNNKEILSKTVVVK